MTELRYWYTIQSMDEKKRFKRYVSETCGVSEKTAKRYLDTQAPKITQQLISTFCEIPQTDLYKQKP